MSRRIKILRLKQRLRLKQLPGFSVTFGDTCPHFFGQNDSWIPDCTIAKFHSSAYAIQGSLVQHSCWSKSKSLVSQDQVSHLQDEIQRLLHVPGGRFLRWQRIETPKFSQHGYRMDAWAPHRIPKGQPKWHLQKETLPFSLVG